MRLPDKFDHIFNLCARILAKFARFARSTNGTMTDYKTTINYAGDEFFIGTSASGHAQVVDTKGERKSAPTPVELVLIAVGACTAVDVISILKKKRQNVTDYKVEVTGSRREEHPRSFEKIHLHHIVYGHDVSEQAAAQAIELSDTKYCSVAATLRPTAEITSSLEIIEAVESSARTAEFLPANNANMRE
jgi:putative redox protein